MSENLDPDKPEPTNIYTHNPNSPRHLHALLFLIGVTGLGAQVLLVSLAGTLVSAVLLRRLLMTAPATLLAFVLDFPGTLAWVVNTFRVWSYGLWAACLLAALGNRPWVMALAAFVLMQYDFGFAMVVGISMVAMSALTHGRRALPSLVGAAMGATLSFAIFVGQLLLYYGAKGLYEDFGVTYARRGDTDAGLIVFANNAVTGTRELLRRVGDDLYSQIIVLFLVWAVVSSVGVLLLARGRPLPAPRVLLARLLISTALGTLVNATFLHPYFMENFMRSDLPLVALLVAPAIGVVAFDLAVVLEPVSRSGAARVGGGHRGCRAAAVLDLADVLLPANWCGLLSADAGRVRRPVICRPVGAVSGGPTGGRAANVGEIDGVAAPRLEQLPGIEHLRRDGELYYTCWDPAAARPQSPGLTRGRVRARSACSWQTAIRSASRAEVGPSCGCKARQRWRRTGPRVGKLSRGQ